MPPKLFDRPKITYPSGCKELGEELGKDELIKRLKLLARAFQDKGQEENSELKELALYLASDFFMDHQSKDVKLLVACCIADIFRIFAPEAPYADADQLKDIFMFLTHQLKGLEDPEAPSFKRYFYLLENLAWVKSFNICLELDENQEIFCTLYRLMFTIVSDKHSSKVVNFMLEMMSPLLSEADAVSQELLDIILLNIVEPMKSRNKHAYDLAKDLIKKTANSIEPYIQTFFNNALMMGKTSESDVSDRLYDLIYELNSIAPNVLLAVLPQLEFKLKSGDEGERKQVTKLLAKMFSDVDSQLALQHKPLWMCFLGRFNDIDIQVRRICVQSAQEFIVSHPELIKDMIEPLSQRQHDPDENVRTDVVQTVINAARKDMTNITDDLLDIVKERTLDKKFKIRKEALGGLGMVYKKSMSLDDEHEHDRVAWIRNKVLHAYYRQNMDDRVLVERILNTSLVPYSLEPDERMQRLLILYTNLDDHAVKALQEVFRSQLSIRVTVRALLELHTKGEGDELRQMINAKINQLSKSLPEPTKAVEYMKKFNKIVKEDQRIRNYLLKLVTPECSCKKAEESVKEILKKMGNAIPQNFLYTNVKVLLERVAPVMIDNLAIKGLLCVLDKVLAGDEEMCKSLPDEPVEKAMKLLLLLANVYPGAFQSEDVFSHLLDLVKHEDEIVSDFAMQIFAFTAKSLEHKYQEIHKTLMPVLQKMVKIGTQKQAKHAIKCINSLCRDKEEIFQSIFEHLKNDMTLDSPNFLTSLVAIGHIAQLCPGEFAAPVKGIVSKFVVKELLMKDRGNCPESMESWYADHLVSEETQAKVQALKMMVRWLLGMKSKTDTYGLSTLRLLHTLVLHEGDLMEQQRMNKAEMARLRLQAGNCMLKLAQESCYADAITLEMFQTLALLINDPCYQVRDIFSQKLHKGLHRLLIPLQYMSIFCLGANDPVKERRNQVKQYLISNINKRREIMRTNPVNSVQIFTILPDYVLPYAIHLLAHDPDLRSNLDTETLKNIKDNLWFILEPLITKNENYSYSFYKKLIENIKQTKDAQNPDSVPGNEKMYAVCDLALSLVMTKAANFILKEFPAEPMLPGKLFTDPDPSYSNMQSYLPLELRMGGKGKKNVTPLSIAQPAKSVPSAADKKLNGSLAQKAAKASDMASDSAGSSVVSSPSSSLKSSPVSGSGRGRGSLSPALHGQVSPSLSASSKTSQAKGKAKGRPTQGGRGRQPAPTLPSPGSQERSPHRPGVFEIVASAASPTSKKPITSAAPAAVPKGRPLTKTHMNQIGKPVKAGVRKNSPGLKKPSTQGKITDFVNKSAKATPPKPGSGAKPQESPAPRGRGRPPKNPLNAQTGSASKPTTHSSPSAAKMATNLRKRAASSSVETSPVKRLANSSMESSPGKRPVSSNVASGPGKRSGASSVEANQRKKPASSSVESGPVKRPASNTLEGGPVKRPRGRPPADDVRGAVCDLSPLLSTESGFDSLSSSTRKPNLTSSGISSSQISKDSPLLRSRKGRGSSVSSPSSVASPGSSPSKSSTASTPKKKSGRLPGSKKDYPMRSNVRRAATLSNGTSDGEDNTSEKRPQREHRRAKTVDEPVKSGTRRQKVQARGKR